MSEITVIVPVYNVEDYIEDCIRSLMKQTYKDYEVLLVDDGSKDNSVGIIKNLIVDDERFKILHKENGGLSSARNHGLKFVKSDFVTFVDSDDFLADDFLYKMLEGIGENKICCCNYSEVTENGKFIRDVKNELSNKSVSETYGDVIEAIKFIPNAWGKVYRKSIFDKLNYPEGMLFEDFAIAYKVFFQEGISFVNESLYSYRIRKGSIMREFNDKVITHKFKILNDMKMFLQSKNLFNFYEINYNNSYIFHGVFVTSCMIINQTSTLSYKYLKELLKNTNGSIFSLTNILTSKTIPRNIKLYLTLLKIFPLSALLLKLLQNKLGETNGRKE